MSNDADPDVEVRYGYFSKDANQILFDKPIFVEPPTVFFDVKENTFAPIVYCQSNSGFKVNFSSMRVFLRQITISAAGSVVTPRCTIKVVGRRAYLTAKEKFLFGVF
jgi:hypothetical protein